MTDTPVWDSGGWLGFSRLTSEIKADLCVVGLGGSGVRAVSEALGRGLDVVGIDAGTVAGGAAGRNGGFLLAGMAMFYHDACEAYGREPARRFYEQTLTELDILFEEGHARRTGSLRIAASDAEAADIELEFAALEGDGFGVEWYEGPEGSGLLIPTNGVCDPLARVREMACLAVDAGATLYEHSSAISIREGVVATGLGSVEAPLILVAVDGGLEVVFADLADRVRTASLQMVATEPLEEVAFDRPVYTDFGHIYYQQLPDRSLALGGGRDRHTEESWTNDPGPIAVIQDELDDVLESMVGPTPVSHRWAGSSAFTEDGRPIMEEILPGVATIGAYSGNGNIVGSIYARMAVEQMSEGRPLQPPLSSIS